MPRETEYGSPFRNPDSGIPENDKENKKRFSAGLQKFMAQERGKNIEIIKVLSKWPSL